MSNLTLVSAVDTFLGSADQAAMRTNLGLGTIATQAASAVAITGGSAALNGGLSTSVAGAVSAPAFTLTGSPYAGGTATTTKPLALIEPTAATSTAWNTAGTLLGVNAATGFAGRLIDVQMNGVSQISVDYTNGLYLRSIQALSFHDANTLLIGGNSCAARMAGTERFWVTGGIGFAASYASNVQTYLLNGGANILYMGTVGATPSTQCFKGPDGSGTNIAAGALKLAPGRSTGSATPATLALQSTAAGSSGTTAQTLVDVMLVRNSQLIEFASGVILDGTGSGFRLGSTSATPIGFWGKAPVSQWASVNVGGGLSSSGSGSAVLDDTTFTGSDGTKAYTIGDIVASLKACGILAQS